MSRLFLSSCRRPRVIETPRFPPPANQSTARRKTRVRDFGAATLGFGWKVSRLHQLRSKREGGRADLRSANVSVSERKQAESIIPAISWEAARNEERWFFNHEPIQNTGKMLFCDRQRHAFRFRQMY